MKLALILFVSFMSSLSFAVTSYPLTCTFSGQNSASWRPSLANGNYVVVGMGFKHSDRPASAGVPEGYCAWQNRAMSPNEPTIIAQEVMNSMSIYEVTYKGVPTLVTAPTVWAAQSKVKGQQITFKVYSSTVSGIAVPVLKIDN